MKKYIKYIALCCVLILIAFSIRTIFSDKDEEKFKDATTENENVKKYLEEFNKIANEKNNNIKEDALNEENVD